jgi:hypothetical protein
MDALLNCRIGPGQFSSEFSIQGEAFDGTPFSLFAPKDEVLLKDRAPNGQTVQGWLRVDAGIETGGLQLIRLPREAFEMGYFVTVRAEQLSIDRGSQKPLSANV